MTAMNRLYWTVLTILIILLALAYAHVRTHPAQRWDLYPLALPVGQDELLYLNQV